MKKNGALLRAHNHAMLRHSQAERLAEANSSNTTIRQSPLLAPRVEPRRKKIEPYSLSVCGTHEQREVLRLEQQMEMKSKGMASLDPAMAGQLRKMLGSINVNDTDGTIRSSLGTKSGRNSPNQTMDSVTKAAIQQSISGLIMSEVTRPTPNMPFYGRRAASSQLAFSWPWSWPYNNGCVAESTLRTVIDIVCEKNVYYY